MNAQAHWVEYRYGPRHRTWYIAGITLSRTAATAWARALTVEKGWQTRVARVTEAI